MSKELKFLYETKVDKIVEDKISVKSSEGVETITPTKVLKPIKIALLKPNRKLYELAEVHYAKTMAYFIKEGLLPYSLVEKRFLNDSGEILNDKEKDVLNKLQEKLSESNLKIAEILNIDSEEANKEKNLLLMKITNLTEQINDIKNVYSTIFENTVEIKSRDRIILWWLLYLAYIEDEKGNYKPIFGDGDLDSKLNEYDSFEDKNDEFYNDVIKKCHSLISYWYVAKNNIVIDEQRFKSIEKMYENSISTYKPKIEEKLEEKPKN